MMDTFPRRKNELLEQLRIIREQKAAIQARLAVLNSDPALKRRAEEYTASNKRPYTAPAQPSLADLLKKCMAIVTQLWNMKDAFVFQRPVDPVRDVAPRYFEFVKFPMDLGTIKEKLKSGKYTSPLQFRDDMRLVWENCRTYNAPNTHVRGMGDRMSDSWEDKWVKSGIEQLWTELETGPQAAAPGPLPPLPSGPSAPLDLKQRQQHALSQLSSQLSSANAAHLASAPIQGGGPMPFYQRRMLSVRLSELDSERLQHVVDIILTTSLPEHTPDSDEPIELDMDKLDDNVLWELQRYISSMDAKDATGGKMHPASGPSKPGGTSQPAPSSSAGGSAGGMPGISAPAGDRSTPGTGGGVSGYGRESEDVSGGATRDSPAPSIPATSGAVNGEGEGEGGEDDVWEQFAAKEEQAPESEPNGGDTDMQAGDGDATQEMEE